MPRMSSAERQAVTYDHLLTFIVQCDMHRLDGAERLRELLRTAISEEREPAEQRLLIAALEYINAIG